jgi:RNA polymerase sigma factor (sigma-70 family)
MSSRKELVTQPDDRTLWQHFKSGDMASFHLVYKLHANTLFRYGMSINLDEDFVQDCIHDVFVEVWTKRERLGDTDSIKFYLIRSLKNRMIQQLENRNRLFYDFPTHHSDALLSTPSFETDLVESQAESEQLEKLNHFIKKLSVRQQEAIRLRYYEGFDYKQVAELLEISQQSAYNLIFRAVEELRRYLLLAFFMVLFLTNF